MISESRFARILRRGIGIKSEIFLRSIGKQPRENLGSRQMRVQLLSLDCHAQGVVVATNLDAFAAAFAKVGNEDREEATLARRFLFDGTENCRNIAVGNRQLLDDAHELVSSRLTDCR